MRVIDDETKKHNVSIPSCVHSQMVIKFRNMIKTEFGNDLILFYYIDLVQIYEPQIGQFPMKYIESPTIGRNIWTNKLRKFIYGPMFDNNKYMMEQNELSKSSEQMPLIKRKLYDELIHSCK